MKYDIEKIIEMTKEMKKLNEEDLKRVYMDWDKGFYEGKIQGLNFVLKLLEEEGI